MAVVTGGTVMGHTPPPIYGIRAESNPDVQWQSERKEAMRVDETGIGFIEVAFAVVVSAIVVGAWSWLA